MTIGKEALLGHGDIHHKSENLSDYLICHDEKVCQIKPGQEKEVVKNFNSLAESLSAEQRALLAEEMISRGLFTDEQAERAVMGCDEEGKLRILIFMAKVLEPGRYDDIFFKLLSNVEAEYSSWLKEFFANEASDRYADFAVFDSRQERSLDVPAKAQKVSDRVSLFINTEESAERAAQVLAKYGQYGSVARGQEIFDYLFARFPVSLLKVLKELKQYDKKSRDESTLIIDILLNLPPLALIQARDETPNELPEWTRNSRLVIDEKAKDRSDQLVRNREEKIKQLARTKQVDLGRRFFGSLDKEQKELILKKVVEAESSYIIYNSQGIILQNLDQFGDCDKSIFEKVLYGIPADELTESVLEEIKKLGFEDRFVEKVCQDGRAGFVFGDLYISGGIEKLSSKNLNLVLKKIAEDDFNYHLLLKNADLLQKYKLLPPIEFIKRRAETNDDSIFTSKNAAGLWAYAEKVKKLKIRGEYALSKKDLIPFFREKFNTCPAEHSFVHSEIFIKVFSEDEQRKKLRQYFSEEDISIHLIFESWENFARFYLEDSYIKNAIIKIIEDESGVTPRHWNFVKKIITNRRERIKMIMAKPETYITSDVLADILEDEDSLSLFVDKIKNEFPTQVPELILSLNRQKASKKVDQAVDLLKVWISSKLAQEPDLFLGNHYYFSSLFMTFTALGREFAPLMRQRFDSWCRQNPEAVWSQRIMFAKFLGNADFQELVRKNKFLLGRDIVEDPGLRFAIREDDPQEQEFLRATVNDILAVFPGHFYDETGTPVSSVKLPEEGLREFVFKKLSQQDFFRFYAKKLRNLLAASEKLAEEAVDPEFVELSSRVSLLSASPAKELFLNLAQALPAKEADRYLKMAETLTALGEDQKLIREHGAEKNPERIKQIMLNAIAEVFKQELDVDIQDSGSRLLENPASVLIYAKMHRNKPGMTALLKEAVAAELAGGYKDWRYFENKGAEGFIKLREKKLLPQKLTYEQYKLWVADDTIEEEAELKVSVAEINAANERFIKAAIEFGHFTAEGAPDIFDPEKNSIKLEDLEEPLRQIQARIGEYQKIFSENKKRKKTDLAEIPFDKNEYEKIKTSREAYLAEYGGVIEYRRAYFYLNRLCHVGAEEIISGKIRLFGEKGGEISLARVFEFLSEVFKNFPEFLNDIGKIRANLQQASGSEDAVKQKIKATDEADFLTAMEIGERPVSSCQHYGRPEFNISLLSYVADPNTKIFNVRGQRGQLIARSISRLLSDGQDNPVLHLEIVYSASPSSKINELLLRFGQVKAKKIGVPLALGSSHSQWPGFDEKNAAKINLSNFSSKNTHVYVDSAESNFFGKEGKYKIKGAVLATK